MKKYKLNKGQSMFEVLVAIFIISLITVGVIVVSTNSVSNSSFSRNSTLAGRYAQEAIEWLRDEEATDTTVFKNRAPVVGNKYTFCIINLNTAGWLNTGVCSSGSEYVQNSGQNTIFNREVVLTRQSVSGKTIIEAEVKVYWTDPKGIHEVKSVTNFSDIREK